MSSSWKNFVQQQDNVSIRPFLHPPIREPQSVRSFQNLQLNGAWVCFPNFGIDLAAETVDCISSDLQLWLDFQYSYIDLVDMNCLRHPLVLKMQKRRQYFLLGMSWQGKVWLVADGIQLCACVLVYLCTCVLESTCRDAIWLDACVPRAVLPDTPPGKKRCPHHCSEDAHSPVLTCAKTQQHKYKCNKYTNTTHLQIQIQVISAYLLWRCSLARSNLR